jgi:GntR family transcriptional regulator / MocR family aminotransferase
MAAIPLDIVTLDRRSQVPLQTQLYRALREAILHGRLRPGLRLPATRLLARDLRIARNTVVAVFEQLAAEGYLAARVGAGTVVAPLRPEALLHAQPPARRSASGDAPGLSRRGAALAAVRRGGPDAGGKSAARAFQVGLPAVDQFPIELWARLLARRVRMPTRSALGYDYAAGLPALCEAIAQYLGAARGVVCRPEQVIVVAGAQAGLDLACRLLLDPGDAAWMEEPGYLGARGALLAASATLVPVPVDDEGLDVAAGAQAAPNGRLVYTSPSHQHPLGVTMSLARRLALLEWAARMRAWVLEDDYDSEYRYGGRPLAAMQGIDATGRVIYVGTFSKTMFPALRVGYLVVPPPLVEPFGIAMRHTGHSAPVAVQAALADFIGEGHFAAHVRRMRVLYASRQARLLRAARRHGLVDVRPAEAGMHLVAALPPDADDVAIAARAVEAGVVVRPISTQYLGRPDRRALLLGYAGVPEREIDRGIELLARVLQEGSRRSVARGLRSKT